MVFSPYGGLASGLLRNLVKLAMTYVKTVYLYGCWDRDTVYIVQEVLIFEFIQLKIVDIIFKISTMPLFLDLHDLPEGITFISKTRPEA
jgi:hypothetical protein